MERHLLNTFTCIIRDLELIKLLVSGFGPLICTYKSEPIYNHKAINLIFQKNMLFTIAPIIYVWMGSGWEVGPSMGMPFYVWVG